MNTTGLIAHWSMSGAGRNVGGWFRSVGELRERLSPAPEVSDERSGGGEASPLLVRPSGAHDWRPLLLATREGDR